MLSRQIPLGSAALAAVIALISPVLAQTSSSKRGLVYVPNENHPDDDKIWVQEPTSLTWYYNYKEFPSSVYQDIPQSEFEFVPMLWGAPPNIDDTIYYDNIKSLINDRNVNVSHLLTFNEPDGPTYYGGSDMQPALAAQVWVNNVIPLQKEFPHLKVGLPGITGAPYGLEWMHQFLANCSSLISTDDKNKKNCTYDFVTIHWYGNFEGLASHLGTYSAAFPNVSTWVTEYNLDNQDLGTTQEFFKMSSEYLDRLDYIERYSIFASFRSSVSNVGPNAAMLNRGGELTDIGAWYLGRESTGVDPETGVDPAASLGVQAAKIPKLALAAAAVAIVMFCL